MVLHAKRQLIEKQVTDPAAKRRHTREKRAFEGNCFTDSQDTYNITGGIWNTLPFLYDESGVKSLWWWLDDSDQPPFSLGCHLHHYGEDVKLFAFSPGICLSMEHHQRVNINAPPHTETSFLAKINVRGSYRNRTPPCLKFDPGSHGC